MAYGLAAGTAVIGCTSPGLKRWWSGRWFFVVLLSLSLFQFQRTAIQANFQLWNPDESQMIAGALTLQERPVFWRDVDGGSTGPLDQFPLLLPGLFGARIDYVSTRVVGALFTVLLLLCLHQVLAKQLGEGTAQLLVLPGWTFFIFNQDPEIAQYTSELPPSLLLALAAALLPGALASGKNSARWCLLAGLAGGAAPLAKLQAAPLAAWILAFGLIALWSKPGEPAGRRWQKAGLLCIGAVLPVLFFAGLAALGGGFDDFYIRYLDANLVGYVAGGKRFFNDERPALAMIFGLRQFVWPVTGGILAGGIAALVWRKSFSRGALIFSLGFVAAALVAIYVPQKPFAHYFIFLIGPIILLLGATAGPVLEYLQSRGSRTVRMVGSIAVLAGLAGPSVAHHALNPAYFPYILRSRPAVSRALLESLQRHVSPGQLLAVWGWQPALYVFTQTVPATPDTVIVWQILPSRRIEFYQSRYLRALTSRPPAVFVDTMGPTDFFFHQAAATRHENFPALQSFIERNYVLAETVADCRIYVRRSQPPPAAP